MQKTILDPTCSARTIWFQKQEPHTVYTDQRTARFEKISRSDHAHRKYIITPDIEADFRHLPFEDESFYLVAFDPPHLIRNDIVKDGHKQPWLMNLYGSLPEEWQPVIRDGFNECMRVLKPNGVLIFKWAETCISTREIINVIGREPLFGHRSGKKAGTHWMTFMKFEEVEKS